MVSTAKVGIVIIVGNVYRLSGGCVYEVHMQRFVGKMPAPTPSLKDFHRSGVLFCVRIIEEIITLIGSHQAGVEFVQPICDPGIGHPGQQHALRVTGFKRSSENEAESVNIQQFILLNINGSEQNAAEPLLEDPPPIPVNALHKQ
jgi:hypothetical protein